MLGLERREYRHLLPGAGDGDVQAAPAAGLVQRPEIQRHPPASVQAVADREEDDIPLVALDILQTLDEHRLRLFRRGAGERPVLGKQLLHLLLDEVLLARVERHDADAPLPFRRVGEPALHVLHDRIGLRLVGPAPAAVVHAFDGEEPHPRGQVVVGRERQERVLIVTGVAERDQALVAAPVMPFQIDRREGQGDALVQDALQVLLVGILLVEGVRLEEGRGRQLLGVADDDERLAAGDGGHRLTRRELGGLVEDDQVELTAFRLQVLRYGERAHQHAGAQARQQVRNPVEQVPEGDAPGVVPDRLLQDRHFQAEGQVVFGVREPGGNLGDQLSPRRLAEGLVILAELLDEGLEQLPAEDAEPLLPVEDMDGIGPVEALVEEVFQPGRIHPSRFELLHDHTQPQAAQAGFLPGIDGIRFQFGEMGAPPHELLTDGLKRLPGRLHPDGPAQLPLQFPGLPPEQDAGLREDGVEPGREPILQAGAVLQGGQVEQLAVDADSGVADGGHIILQGGLHLPEAGGVQGPDH